MLFCKLFLQQNEEREEKERKKAARRHVFERDNTDFDMPDGADITDGAHEIDGVNEATGEEREGIIDSLRKKIRRGKILRRRSIIQHTN